MPTIAAVNGAAVTGGFEIALACDFIVASERARFADTHVRVGVYPGPVLVDLPRRVGMAKAREMSMTGNFVDAETALRIGLANHVVAARRVAADRPPVGGGDRRAEPADDRRHATATGTRPSTLPLRTAHRRHREIAAELGFSGAGSDTLTANMAAVVARARTQL